MTFKTFSRKIRTLLNNPRVLLLKGWHGFEPFVSDEIFLSVLFRLKVGYWPNLKNPQSYNEKLQWLKLNYRRAEYTEMVDKVAAKEYVARIVGSEYIIPTIGIWDNINDIEWERLPNRFVIKASHDSGGVVVCKDKSKLNIEETVALLSGTGKRDYTKYNKEYAYHDVPHRYIAEEYMEDESGFELKDYKIFCFNGTPEFLFVATGRQQHDTRFDFYDLEFNHLPVKNGHPNADLWPVKPENFEEMLMVAEKLAKGLPHVRVDLYNINGKIYFGELTFFHFSGLTAFTPVEWDYRFGEYMTLPTTEQV